MRTEHMPMTELPLEADEGLVQIYDRALSAKIPCAWYARGARSPMLKLRLPDGASGVVVDVKPEDAERFARTPFENIVLLGKYLAHWNKDRGEIIAGIRKSGLSSQLWSIPGVEPIPEESGPDAPAEGDLLGQIDRLVTRRGGRGRLTFSSPSGNPIVTLQAPPPEELFFCGEIGIISASLRIEGVELNGAEEATRFLFDISHAIFFELDVNYSVTLQLCLRIDNPPVRVEYPRVISSDHPRFPALRFPRDAIALYMHARTINAAPLTEYLTYYQVIEHCMTALSRPHVIRRLRGRLADPAFDLDDDVALSELLIQPGRSGQSNMTEREQIRLAVRACITAESIEELLRSDESLGSFVSDPDTALASRPIEIRGNTANLPRQLADRIYDLRCRIVHAKGNAFDEAGSPLLPFNADANLLRHDLQLVRFAAQQVLLTAAIPAEA
jgi:hypothetical protein